MKAIRAPHDVKARAGYNTARTHGNPGTGTPSRTIVATHTMVPTVPTTPAIASPSRSVHQRTEVMYATENRNRAIAASTNAMSPTNLTTCCPRGFNKFTEHGSEIVLPTGPSPLFSKGIAAVTQFLRVF